MVNFQKILDKIENSHIFSLLEKIGDSVLRRKKKIAAIPKRRWGKSKWKDKKTRSIGQEEEAIEENNAEDFLQ